MLSRRLTALVLTAGLLGCAAEPPPPDGPFEAPLGLAGVDSQTSGGAPAGPGVQLGRRAYLDDEELVDELRLGRSEPGEPGGWWLAPSPVDDLVVCGVYEGIELWRVDPTTGARVRLDARRVGPRERGTGHRVEQAAWHPTGRYVVTLAGEGLLQAWRPEPPGGGEPAQLVPCPRATTQDGRCAVGLAFLPDGGLLVLTAAGALERWALDLGDGQLTRERELGARGPTGQVRGGLVVVSPDGRRAFLSRSSWGEVWELGDRPRSLGQVRFGGHAWMRAAAFSADGRLLAVGGGGQERGIATLHEVTDEGLAERGTLLDDHVRGNADLSVLAVVFRKGEVVLATTRSLERWRTSDPPSLLGAVRGRSQTAVVFAADGSRALDDDLRLWRVEDGEPGLRQLGGPAESEDQGLVVARSPDGRLAVRRGEHWGKEAALWPLDASESAADLGEVGDAIFSPDGRWLLTTAEGEVTAWRLGGPPWQAEATDSLAIEGEWVGRPCLAVDGRFTVLGEALTLGRLDPEGRLTLLERWAPCADAALSPSGDTLLATDGPRGPPGARLWRLVADATGRVTRVPVALLGPGLTSAVTFSPDGALAVTRGLQADLWRLDPTGGLPRHEGTLADVNGPVTFREGAVVVSRLRGPRRVQVSGEQAIDVAGQPLRWDRPASASSALPDLAVRVEREAQALVVTVTNAGPGPAHELLGRLRFEDERAPLGESLPLAFGSVPPGQAVTRRLALPTGPGLWLRDLTWAERFGRAPPPTSLDPAPVQAPVSVRREVLREAGRLALDLARDEVWASSWLGAALQVALARDGDLAAALQLCSPAAHPRHRADLSALAAGDTSELVQRWSLEGEVAVRQALDRRDLGAALEAAERIPGHDEPRLEVSAALARAGRVDDALRLGPGYGFRSSAITALLEAASARVEAGDLEGARALVRRVVTESDVDPLEPASWFVDVDFSPSMSLSWRVTGRPEELVRAAARLHVQLGLSDGARYLAAFDGRRPELVRTVAAGQTAAGDPEGAREWAARLTDPAARAGALLGIGEALLPPLRPSARGW